MIDYNHALNRHGVQSPALIMPLLLERFASQSLLDVGCGTGNWLKAAQSCGLTDVLGIDGIELPAGQLLVDRKLFRRQDLTKPLTIERKFDLCLCLEVAEHLPPDQAPRLVADLCSASDVVVFSAAIPHQPGQHHVNCQWPVFWQRHFNNHGFTCDGDLRLAIWNEIRIDPWYRQNLFFARRDPSAGNEPRLLSLIHPDIADMIRTCAASQGAEQERHFILNGGLRARSYWTLANRVLLARIAAKIGLRRNSHVTASEAR